MKTRKLRIGSLCTGYGGLDMATMEVFGGKLAWCADNDKHVSTVLKARYPRVPNLGDLKALSWRQLDSIDIITAGFPCQDISYSGRGAGIEKGAQSGVWKNIVKGIRLLQPKLVIVENVAALRKRGLGRVLGDLAALRYNANWTSVRASDGGAAHRRERVFILGWRSEAAHLLAAAYARSQRRGGRTVTDQAAGQRASGRSQRLGSLAVANVQADRTWENLSDGVWGRYAAAIRSWEVVIGRTAPTPTELGTRGQARLSPAFSEWLMGLPQGFVTDLDLPYGAQHRIIGNGVVPQQAKAALSQLVVMAVDGRHGSANTLEQAA
jgi:DNA (cytosine-5)-methyltransferase 1